MSKTYTDYIILGDSHWSYNTIVKFVYYKIDYRSTNKHFAVGFRFIIKIN